MRLPALVALAGLAVSCAHGAPSAAAPPAAPELPTSTDAVRFEYRVPRDPSHRAIYAELQEDRILEQLAEALSPLRLPRTLTLAFAPCDGTSNAWFDPREVTVTFCYEYVAELFELAATKKLGPVPLEEARIGPVVFVFLHETGHAVFYLLDVPIMGREEDAADNFATVSLLRLGHDIAMKMLRGTAWQYAQEAQSRPLDYTDYADVHGLDAQRYYNILCLAYGSDPKGYALVVDDGYLPADRAEGCADEFSVAAYAMKKLITPSIDMKKAQQLRARRGKKWETGQD